MKAMVRNNICLNAHPKGCKKAVLDQIEYTKARAEARKNGTLSGLDERDNNGVAAPKNVLVLGCSNGYGLASRITASFAYGAATIGVSFEKAGTEKKWGTPGWYNNLAFDQAAKEANIKSITIDGDAFSNEIKDQVVKAAKENNMVPLISDSDRRVPADWGQESQASSWVEAWNSACLSRCSNAF